MRFWDGTQWTLQSHRQVLDLPEHSTFGIYINDADNSGYSLSCSANDADGLPIQLRYPGWHMTSSETEMLDYVFDTGPGDVAMSCLVPGDRSPFAPSDPKDHWRSASSPLDSALTSAAPATTQAATATPK